MWRHPVWLLFIDVSSEHTFRSSTFLRNVNEYQNENRHKTESRLLLPVSAKTSISLNNQNFEDAANIYKYHNYK